MRTPKSTIDDAARTYYRNIQGLRNGKVTIAEHRAVNRSLRITLGDNDWEQAKAIALSNDQRVLGY